MSPRSAIAPPPPSSEKPASNSTVAAMSSGRAVAVSTVTFALIGALPSPRPGFGSRSA
jgi:hypothetical protein